jgi:ABC-2 type transport system permease protein
MNHIIDIAIKDIQETLRDRKTALFLLIMPIIFTVMFGFAFGGSAQGNSDPRLVIGFLDLDHSNISSGLRDFLQSSKVVRLDQTAANTSTDLEKLVTNQKLIAGLVVPIGYGDALKAGKALKLTIIANPASSAVLTARGEVLAAATRLTSSILIAQTISKNTGGSFDPLLSETLSAWQNPPVSLTISSALVAANDKKVSSGSISLTNTAPGMMLQFGIAGLITAAQVMVNERKSRCMQRLLTTAVARHEILLGHFLAIFATIFVQFLILIAFGQIALHLNYLRLPLGTLVMAITSALFIAALGLLIGALAKTDEQAIIFAMIPMFAFAGLGGAWVPLEATGKAFQAIGHLTPVAWALDGFENIIARGLAFNSLWLPAGALIGYAIFFFGLAVWKFKFE